MISRFLNAKHWQIFMLIFGIPIIFQIFLLTSIFTIEKTDGVIYAGSFFKTLIFYPIIMLLYITSMLGWNWSVAIGLQKHIPNEHKLKLRKFKILFFFPLVYMLFLIIYIGFKVFQISSYESGFSGEIDMLFFIIPMHMFSMFCIFYELYILSKTVKTAELKKKVNFSDYFGEFLLIWFLPIGIWIIQPKINRIVKEQDIIVGRKSKLTS